MAQEDHSLLTTGQAAKRCEVTPDTILKWIKKGRLRGARTAGGHYRIHPRDLEPLIPADRRDAARAELPTCLHRELHCWEYLSEGGNVREECQHCVVYRVRATQCFLMANLGAEIGHARQFCQTSCEDCGYYRRVTGLPPSVLVISPNDSLLERLSAEAEDDDSTCLRCARNGYEASTLVEHFRAAFVVVDEDLLATERTGLLQSLSTDPRLPAVEIVLAVRRGTSKLADERTMKDTVFNIIEKPFGIQEIAAVVNEFPIGRAT